MITSKTIFPVGLLVLLLAGCGGGGGGGTTADRGDTAVSVAYPSSAAGGAPSSSTGVASGGSSVTVVVKDSDVRVPVMADEVPVAEIAEKPRPEPVPSVVPAPPPPVVPAPVVPRDDPPVVVADMPVVLPSVDPRYLGRQTQADGDAMSDTDFTGTDGGLFTVTVSGTDVSVTVREKFNTYPLTETEKTVTSLKDTDNSLLGYYGSALAYTTEPNRTTGSVADQIKYNRYNIFYAMNKERARLPDVEASYTGDFVFLVEGVKHTATALFRYSEKTLDGSIKQNVAGSGTVREWETTTKADVEDDGTFHARLISKKTSISDGEMTGGFFGTNGQVLAATAKSTAEATDKEKWQGIVVAEQMKPPASP